MPVRRRESRADVLCAASSRELSWHRVRRVRLTIDLEGKAKGTSKVSIKGLVIFHTFREIFPTVEGEVWAFDTAENSGISDDGEPGKVE